MTIDAIRDVDHPLIMSTVLVGTLVVMGSNLIVDLIYFVLDPESIINLMQTTKSLTQLALWLQNYLTDWVLDCCVVPLIAIFGPLIAPYDFLSKT